MAHPHPSFRRPRPRRRRGAFTLIQLLVAIGIIVVLIGILLPTVVSARKQAQRTRQSLDLEAITTALEAFKADHGEYPSNRFLETLTLMHATSAGGKQVTASELDVPKTGAELLGYCLLGSGPALEDATSSGPFTPGQFMTASGAYYVCLQTTATAPMPADTDHWWPVLLPYWDNQNGAGLRAIPPLPGQDNNLGTADDVPQGKSFGPYLDATRFKTRGLQILDQWGNPILYFPANPAKPDVHRKPAAPVVAGYIESVPAAIGTNPRQPRQALWDAAYGIDANVSVLDSSPTFNQAFHVATADTSAEALRRFEIALGDVNQNGYVDSGDGPAVTKDYLLWSAGPDGIYGYNEGTFNAAPGSTTVTTADLSKSKNFDDVTNFRE